MSQLWSYFMGPASPRSNGAQDLETPQTSGADWEFVTDLETPQEGEDEFVIVPIASLPPQEQIQIPESAMIFDIQNCEVLHSQEEPQPSISDIPQDEQNVSSTTPPSTQQAESAPIPRFEYNPKPFSFDEVDNADREAWLHRQEQPFQVQEQVGFQQVGSWGSAISTVAPRSTAVVLIRRKQAASPDGASKGVQIALPGGTVVRGVHVARKLISFVSSKTSGSAGSSVSGTSGKTITFAFAASPFSPSHGHQVSGQKGSQITSEGGKQSPLPWGSEAPKSEKASTISSYTGSEVLCSRGGQVAGVSGVSVASTSGGQVVYQ